jgi:uncharacterized DUF497 family protein
VIFEFDPKKSASNKVKHGIDFAEAQALWLDNRIEIQARIEGKEIRYAVLGKIGFFRENSGWAEQISPLR